MPPRSRKGWKSKADKLWSKYILTRDVICRCCNKLPAKHPHHIISRRYHNTRFMTANGVGLCVKCHFMAHQNPVTFHKTLLELFGQDHLDTLEALSQKICKIDYESVCNSLQGGE